MAKKKDKKADRVRHIFNRVNTASRQEWEYVNQKGFDFANDNQLTEQERSSLLGSNRRSRRRNASPLSRMLPKKRYA